MAYEKPKPLPGLPPPAADRRAARRRRRRASPALRSRRFGPARSRDRRRRSGGSRSASRRRPRSARRCARRRSAQAAAASAVARRARDRRSAPRRPPLSLALGLWSAWLAVRSPAPIDTIALGAWQAWPNAGTADVDPYSRARLARTGEIPLGSGEGLMLLAQTDDRGAPLVVALRLPDRRADAAGAAVDGGAGGRATAGSSPERDGVAALGSDTLLRAAGRLLRDRAVAAAARPATGSPPRTPARFRVVVRLYDTTARTGDGADHARHAAHHRASAAHERARPSRAAATGRGSGSAASRPSSSARCLLAGADPYLRDPAGAGLGRRPTAGRGSAASPARTASPKSRSTGRRRRRRRASTRSS